MRAVAIAATSRMSARFFHAHLKAITRSSPMQYVKSVLLHQAARHSSDSDLSARGCCTDTQGFQTCIRSTQRRPLLCGPSDSRRMPFLTGLQWKSAAIRWNSRMKTYTLFLQQGLEVEELQVRSSGNMNSDWP